MRMLIAGAMLGMSTIVLAQGFPARPLTLIVPTVPGGSTDFTARLLQDPLSKGLGQPVIVENRSGASGNIGTELVARAKPDGYTLLVQFSGYHVGNPHLFKGLKWDPIKDFQPIGLALYAPQVIAVGPSTKVTTLKELVDLIRATPGKVSYGSAGSGSIQHLAGEILEQQAGGRMVHVPYKGSGPAVVDLMGGNIDIFITTPPGVIQQVQAGRLRAIAYAARARHPSMPNVPTAAEAGFPKYEVASWFGVLGPAGIPQDVVKRLADELRKAVESKEFREKADSQGAFAVFQDPTAFARTIAQELTYWGEVIKTAKIAAE
ncbi:MAG: tripartite tricarboxylate transporter substrate binding protein [Proteobacteria bacterium]|nr:tripartite tricarboxylate transporter substrate binding protein [Burkholderiales bacterium]